MNATNVSESKFRALYYPYSRCLSEIDLKRAALVFDEILFVDPLSSEITEPPGQIRVDNPNISLRMYVDESKEQFPSKRGWYNISNVYELLQRNGIAKLIMPQNLLEPYDDIQTFSALGDFLQGFHEEFAMDDRGYNIWLETMKKHGPRRAVSDSLLEEPLGWRIHVSRIPDSLISISRDEKFLKNIVKRYEKVADFHGTYPQDQRIELLKRCLTKISKAKENAINGAIILPVGLAYPLILNQALLLCDHLGAYPITDDPIAHQTLINKAENIYGSTNKSVRGILPKLSYPNLYCIQYFTLSVVSRMIPDEALQKLSIEQVIKFRANNSDSLKRFHEKMLMLALSITSEPWEQGFDSNVIKKIETEVIPEIRKLDDQLKDSYMNLYGASISKFGESLTKLIAPSLPTITMAAFLGLTTSQIVTLGAASLVSGLGLILPDLVNHINEKKKLQRNGLAFLMKFKDEHL